MTEYGLLQLQTQSGGLRAGSRDKTLIENSDQADASPARMTAEISTSRDGGLITANFPLVCARC